MSGDWIKMRTSLMTNPKVNGIARALEESREVSRVLSTGFNGPMCEIVTRNVMRYVTVSLLLIVWGAANEHTDNGVFKNADLSDIDDMVGVPGFGDAMASVGWAEHDSEANTVTLPNFSEYNTSSASRSASARSSAERQRDYRERKKSQESDVTRYATRDVTVTRDSNRREEKRREEKEERDMSSAKPTTDSKEAERVAELTRIAVEAYNATMTGLPKVALVNDVRRRQVRRCLPTAREICRTMFGTPRIPAEFWPSYFAACQADDFCAGRTVGSGTHANWRPDFEYLTRAEVMTRIFDRASEANR